MSGRKGRLKSLNWGYRQGQKAKWTHDAGSYANGPFGASCRYLSSLSLCAAKRLQDRQPVIDRWSFALRVPFIDPESVHTFGQVRIGISKGAGKWPICVRIGVMGHDGPQGYSNGGSLRSRARKHRRERNQLPPLRREINYEPGRYSTRDEAL